MAWNTYIEQFVFFKTKPYKTKPSMYCFSSVVSGFLLAVLSNVFNGLFFKERIFQFVYYFFMRIHINHRKTTVLHQSIFLCNLFVATHEYYIKIKCSELTYIFWTRDFWTANAFIMFLTVYLHFAPFSATCRIQDNTTWVPVSWLFLPFYFFYSHICYVPDCLF